MKLLKYLVLLLSLTTSNLLLAETTLTEASVNKMLNDIQTTVIDKNLTGFASYFTKDSTITIVMPENMGGTSTIGKQEYLRMLEQGWALPAEYTYEIRDIKINVAPDGQSAIATDVTLETVAMDGKVVASTRSYETINIVLHDGGPKIKALRGEVEMQ
jgi:hypothetical protein